MDRERKREREREKEKEKERERGTKKRGIERERQCCLCKRCFFLLLAPGSPQEIFAAIANPGNKLN
jgi:hypothetical protein